MPYDYQNTSYQKSNSNTFQCFECGVKFKMMSYSTEDFGKQIICYNKCFSLGLTIEWLNCTIFSLGIVWLYERWEQRLPEYSCHVLKIEKTYLLLLETQLMHKVPGYLISDLLFIIATSEYGIFYYDIV